MKRKVYFSFKGEAIVDINSFMHIYNEEPLEIQIFTRKDIEKIENEEEENSEASLYGVCKIDLTEAIPNVPILFQKGGPIRGQKGSYNLYHPHNKRKVVGRINVNKPLYYAFRFK